MPETPSTRPASAGATPHRLRALVAGGITGNRALTSTLGVLLLVLLAVQVLSALGFALLSYNLPSPGGPIFDVVRPLHFFVGFLLFPLIGLKLSSAGYRFSRYYTGNAAYHDAATPRPVPRLIAPLLVLSAAVLFGTGVEMWCFRNPFRIPWIPLHA